MTKTPEVKEETPELISREEYIADIKTRWKLFVKEINAFTEQEYLYESYEQYLENKEE